MYQIFVNQKPIVLTTKVEREDGFKNYLLETANIGKIIKDMNTDAVQEVRLIGSNENKLIKQFLKLLPNVEAGGGKVYNDKGEVLFIYRNNKWDLPKGRIDGDETFEEGAMREVEEETGVSGLKITKQLSTTYHIFKRNGKHKIKITYWFEMKTSYKGTLVPEVKEGITKVDWLNASEINKALENSYANIRLLVK
ncbi:NUDIX hydrolase [Psychroserpens sp.]|uniref:NUDIX hydrolase n=1 Tax=Psychroserpens sp. TaxID=2020870 RepID=UPI001B2DECAC|nr:NUDIX domain-containing protein [Psychroserpens sp.]MBO6606264.1 NUDIX domain-containing protein [Psychroserpens sp.]MBO6632482.1 NUDIX domain-containing protein [Psychroserpens sp.]MBO6652364.1 NUDIX domain-containing protein [Psychroserpens sp.]MBO6681864.1 NUDIX domain-containing protein [Psychroserpens sp.]MBO6749639.1 NUDIX domain-containing protein [Psychroserpens sp.]